MSETFSVLLLLRVPVLEMMGGGGSWQLVLDFSEVQERVWLPLQTVRRAGRERRGNKGEDWGLVDSNCSNLQALASTKFS